MLEIISKESCCGCFACYNICPKQCISMLPDDDGFLYPEIDSSLCIECGLCEKVCPIITSLPSKNNTPDAFAAINKNEDIRSHSSSGGIFTLLAEHFIQQGGIVFGAAMSGDCKAVKHIAVETCDALELLRGSKYVQSTVGDTYRLAKEELDGGRSVLYSGTPCQISGLYKYLGKTYEKLLTCDFICHGVPSPKVWKKYVEHREEKAASQARRTFFRHKKYGWKRYSLQFFFTNCTEYLQIASKDLYLRGFISNIYLRPSCYNCSFKGVNRPADITLADFWGIENVLPEMNDNKGTSLVLLHSEKGKKAFDTLTDSMKICKADLEKAVKYNSSSVKSVPIPPKRTAFFKDLEALPFEKLMSKYCSAKPKEKIKKLLGRILRKIKNQRRA